MTWRKSQKNSDIHKVAVMVLKQSGFTIEMCLKDADQMANSVHPDQTAPKGGLTRVYTQDHLSLVTRKPVFGVCDQLRLEPACSADVTS